MVLGDLHLNFGDYVRKAHGGQGVWEAIVAAAGHKGEDTRWVSSCPYSDAIFEG